MQIVIDIDEEDYDYLYVRKEVEGQEISRYDQLILNGTPLPKGHGRLIDADKLKTHFIGTEQGTDLEVYLEPTIIDAPTIIEAEV